VVGVSRYRNDASSPVSCLIDERYNLRLTPNWSTHLEATSGIEGESQAHYPNLPD
jgi:hypothetical protein